MSRRSLASIQGKDVSEYIRKRSVAGAGANTIRLELALISHLYTEFETPTQSGLTDKAGTFNYQAGEVVKFYIGGILLGSATGAATLTPINLVPSATDETSPQVINILRFLQSLDSDSNLTNGIQISAGIRTALASQALDFTLAKSAFETAFNSLSGAVLGGVALVTVVDAQAHMKTTLESLRLGRLTISGVDTAIVGTGFAPIIVGVSTIENVTSVLWSGLGNIGSVGISTLDGQLATLSFSFAVINLAENLVIISQETYSYNISCWPAVVAAADCSKITLDVGTKRLTLNNVELAKGRSGAFGNSATGPITINGTLYWK